MAACKTPQPEFSTLDTINGSWRLPSKSVYEYSNRIGEQRIIFPHQDWSYWTSTPLKNNPDRAFFYNPAVINSTVILESLLKVHELEQDAFMKIFAQKLGLQEILIKTGKLHPQIS
jgi:hypothetical protein